MWRPSLYLRETLSFGSELGIFRFRVREGGGSPIIVNNKLRAACKRKGRDAVAVKTSRTSILAVQHFKLFGLRTQ